MAGFPEDKAELRLRECAREITELRFSNGLQPRVPSHLSVVVASVYGASLST